jgi:tetratricopeptide (TPR) repeat protein
MTSSLAESVLAVHSAADLIRPPSPSVTGSADTVIAAATRQMLEAALRFHRAGQFQQAALVYGRILQIDPDHADSLHLLGMVASQARQPEMAIDLIQRAIALNGGVAAYHSNLGSIFQGLGKLDEAVDRYTLALSLDPRLPEIHLNLGLVLQTQGRLDEAIASYRQAVALDPNLAAAHSNLGNGLQALGNLDEAIAHYQTALALNPRFPEAWYNLGNSQLAQDKLEDAAASYRRALSFNGSLAEAHCNLGNVLQRQEKLDEAMACYEQALQIKPACADAHYNLANVLSYQGKLQPAVTEYELALRYDPSCVKAHNNLGNVLRTLERPEEAVAHYRQIPDGSPEFTDAYCNLGLALLTLGRHDEAIQSIERTLALKPEMAEAHCNKGAVLHAQNRVAEARATYQHSLQLKPGLAKAALNLGMIELVMGEFAAGWKNYEYRWNGAPFQPRDFQRPQWRGGPLCGARILLHAEQGLGDTLQFIRYVPLVQAAGGVVILEVQDRLMSLAAELPGVVEVVSWGAALPPFDYHCPMLSLPLAFGTTLETVPAEVPYLYLPEASHAKMKLFPWPEDGLRIGLLWAGNPTFLHDRYRFRSAALELFEPLADLDGLRLFSLQIGESAKDLSKASWSSTKIVDLAPMVNDMGDTAAQIAKMDLVITVDTSVAHLAGALGVPVWVMMPYTPDWRWLQDRSDTPWYPSMRLFRQSQPGDWRSVMEAMTAELKKFACQRDQTRSLRLISSAFSAAVSLEPSPETPETPEAVAVYSPLLEVTLPE